MTGRVLVAGIGNLFLGDDAFGVEVTRRLAEESLPGDVVVVDYGISGVHLAYDLLEHYRSTILVDAVSTGAAPGTVTVRELDPARHDSPEYVYELLEVLGDKAGQVFLVGCEPASVDAGIGLSAPCTRAVDDAVTAVLRLLQPAAAPTPPREPTPTRQPSEV